MFVHPAMSPPHQRKSHPEVFFFRPLAPLWSIGLISRFLVHFTDGTTPWTGDQLVSRRLLKHRTTQTQNQTTMPCVGFETTISASKRAKTVHALDRSATVTGS
jgi:hypothetical protein